MNSLKRKIFILKEKKITNQTKKTYNKQPFLY